MSGCNLHVSHSWGGGIGRWVDDFVHEDVHSRNLVLRSHGTAGACGLELRLTEGASGSELGRWVLERPIAEIADRHSEYRRILDSIVSGQRVTHVYVSALIGHALDALELGVPTTIVHHDYHPYCAALFSHFSRVCTDCSRTRLAACLKSNPLSAPSRRNGPDHWLAIRERWLDLVTMDEITHVVPSASVGAQFAALEEAMEGVRFHVIPHGQRPAEDCFGGAEDGRRLRLVLLGRLSYEKGLADFHAIATDLLAIADVALVGAGPPGALFATLPGVELVRRYKSGELTRHLRRLRPDLALSLSIVPETFSYTLAEAWAHRIPVAARAVGSLSDRIDHGHNGFHLGGSAQAILAGLRELDADRGRIRSAQRALPPVRRDEVAEMVDRYYALRDPVTPNHAGPAR